MPSSIEFQKQYYDQRWRGFTHANQYDRIRVAQVLNFLSICSLPPNPKICDLGCGAGWTTAVLGVFGEATGIDLSSVDAAQARYPYCRFVSANILECQHPEAAFDVVASIEVLEHMDSSKQREYVAIAYRILKPGGYLILTTPNKATMDAIPGGGRTWSDQPVENWISATGLRLLLSQNGFQTREMTSVVFGFGRRGSYRIVNSTKLNTLIARISATRMWRGALARANYGLHLAVLAQKPE